MKRHRLPESVAPDHTTKRSIRRSDYNLEDCLWMIMCPLVMAMIVLAVLMLGGCTKTVYVPTETAAVRTDSAYRAVYIDRLIVERDTVRISVSATVNENGDTMRTDTRTELTHWKDRSSETHDTVYQAKTDTLRVREPYPVEVVREVERNPNWRERAMLSSWGWMAAALAICIGWVLRRPIAALLSQIVSTLSRKLH